MEIGLVGVIFYHMFTGLRITLIDMGVMVEKQKVLFVISVVVWLACWGGAAAVMISRMISATG
jgi:succinate dehydrogenase/fumarate reductase cytochrome b subunit